MPTAHVPTADAPIRLPALLLSLQALVACNPGALPGTDAASRLADALSVCDPNATQKYTGTNVPTIDIPGAVEDGRTPATVYYAVDTLEPFMQVAVDEDIRSLRQLCEGTEDPQRRAKIHWLAFVNSHITDGTPSHLSCRGGRFAEEPLPEPVLTQIRAAWAQQSAPEAWPESDPYRAVKAAGYRDYPLAVRKVFLKLMEYAQATLPSAELQLQLHIKSHASEQLVLTGLTPDVTASKSDCQRKILQALGRELPTITPGSAGLTRDTGGEALELIKEPESGHLGIRGQMVLGPADGASLGERGQIILGTGAGLGAHNHFGTPLRHLLADLTYLVQRYPEMRIGGIMLEGCHSAGRADMLETLLPMANHLLSGHVATIYAAQGSLWYRNFDWKTIHDRQAAVGGGAQGFLDILAEYTGAVTNWVPEQP